MAQKTIAELQAIFVTGATPTQQDFADFIENSIRSDKIYSATLSQSGGGGNIDAIIGKNTLGAVIVWNQIGIKTHEGTLVGAFPVDKTHVLISNGINIPIGAFRSSDDVITVKCEADGEIAGATILIWIDP